MKSGIKSEHYFNTRVLVSHPYVAELVAKELLKLIRKYYGHNIVLAGVPMGALHIVSVMSQLSKLKTIVPRLDKDYGFDGDINPDDEVVVFEDVVTTGTSLNEVYEHLANRCNVIGKVCLLHRNPENSDIPSLFTLQDFTETYIPMPIVKSKSIMFSADLEDQDSLTEMIKLIAPKVEWIKLHLDGCEFYDKKLFIEEMKIIKSEHNVLFIEDRKFVDIGNTCMKQYRQLTKQFRSEEWIDGYTIVPVAGNGVFDALISCNKNINLLVVAQMSTNENLFSEEVTGKILDLCVQYSGNVIGVVAQDLEDFVDSGKHLKYRNGINKDIPVFTPGISLTQTYDYFGQKYKMMGSTDSDVYIIGRGIYEAENPEKEVEKYRKVIK